MEQRPYLNTGGFEQNPLYHSVAHDSMLHNPNEGPMRVAVGVSGSGTNLLKILEAQQELGALAPYEIVAVFADTKTGYKNANKHVTSVLGAESGIKIYDSRPSELLDSSAPTLQDDPEGRRASYDMALVEQVQDREINFLALGGFMRLLSPNLTQRVFGINVHPGPLNVIDPLTGQRKYTGDDAVKDQILAGEDYLQSTVNLLRSGADTGEVILMSNRVRVERTIGDAQYSREQIAKNSEVLKIVSDFNQDRLKEKGDWVIFPMALEAIANGWYVFDQRGQLMYNRNFGIKLNSDAPTSKSFEKPEDLGPELLEHYLQAGREIRALR